MPIENAYADDLAYIHDQGYKEIARDAASRVIKELSTLGCRSGTVVDIGCGSGLLAHALATAGYDVVGIDLSEAMIALARARVPGAQFRVESFVTATVPASVAVVASGEVLSYAFDSSNDNAARVDWFRRVYEALLPGGLLLFDIAGPGRVPPSGTHHTFAAGSDWAVLVESGFEAAKKTLVRKIISFRQVGELYRRGTEIHRLALLDPADVLTSLHEIGLRAENIPAYGSASLPPGVVAFLCRKPGVTAV